MRFGAVRAVVFGVLTAFLMVPSIWAVEPSEILDDPALEARARALSKDLRCLVCQNQSIDDSNAGLAKDLRVLVRERLVAGDSDDQVIDYLVDRYGDYVLLDPPVKPETWLLWYGPFIVFGLGTIGMVVYLAKRRRPSVDTPAPLDESERAELDALLAEEGRPGPDPSNATSAEGETRT